MIRRIGLASVSVIALTAAASAADLYGPGPVGPDDYRGGPSYAPAWAGFYAGINGGGGWSEGHDLIFSSPSFPGVWGDAGKFESSGGFGGAQIGYNWQGGLFSPRVVFGIEADIQGSAIDGTFSRTADYFGPTLFNGKQDIDYFGTVRGRIGYAFDHMLIYGTGGLAYGGVDTRLNLNNSTFTNNLTRNETEVGFVVGSGVEYAFSPKWSVKVEYQFIDLGDQHLSNVGSDGYADHARVEDSFSTVRLGLNYHFQQESVPLK